MKKYYVINGKIVINKYCVKYTYTVNSGSSEITSEVIQYCRNDNELNALVTELEQKDIEYTISALDVSDILMFYLYDVRQTNIPISDAVLQGSC